MKTQRGSRGIALLFLSLTSALDGGGWSKPRPGRFKPGTHCTGDLVGPRAGLDGC
jgi:hypothetical protein